MMKSDKENYCKLFECHEKQGIYENQIANLQTDIDSIDEQLRYLRKEENEKQEKQEKQEKHEKHEKHEKQESNKHENEKT